MSGTFLRPAELSQALVVFGKRKAEHPIIKMILLGILAGVYIGFAAHFATTVSTGYYEWSGIKKLVVGSVFTVGLMLVIIPGSELFTGNNLMTVALCEKEITWSAMMRNWSVVYLANLVGSVFLAFMIAKSSGLLSGAVGATAIKIATAKTSSADIAGIGHNYAFFFRAIGCNWLVCLAVMIAMSAQDTAGKILGIFFPIMTFVSSGFEHVVANMYFIPAGIFAKSFPNAVSMSRLSVDQLAELNWESMFTQNLFIVTIGNIIGGAIFTGVIYWYVYVKSAKRQ